MVKDKKTILDYVKTKVDIETDDDTTFDNKLLMDIETSLSELSQIVSISFDISELSKDTTFEEIFSNIDSTTIGLCKSYIGVSVRLLFDPPNGSILTSMERHKDVLSSRILVQMEGIQNE